MAGWTTQSLIDGGMTITGFCSACERYSDLDLFRLREKLGPDAPAMASDLTPKLRCQGCGEKRISLIYRPDTDVAPSNSAPMCGKNPNT